MSLIIHPLTHRPDLDCRRYRINVVYLNVIKDFFNWIVQTV